MGLLSDLGSKLQHAKDRILVSSNLCGHSWKLISNNQSASTFVFKSNGQLIISRDGFISPYRWDYLTENNSLIITDDKGCGIGYRLDILKATDLISLVRLSSSERLFLSDENSPTSPKTMAQIEDIIVSTKVALIKSAVEQLLDNDEERTRSTHIDNYAGLFVLASSRSPYNRNTSAFRSQIDSLLDDLSGTLLERIIDLARLECPDIENEISDITERLEQKRRFMQNIQRRQEQQKEYESKQKKDGPFENKNQVATLIDFLNRPQFSGPRFEDLTGSVGLDLLSEKIKEYVTIKEKKANE